MWTNLAQASENIAFKEIFEDAEFFQDVADILMKAWDLRYEVFNLLVMLKISIVL